MKIGVFCNLPGGGAENILLGLVKQLSKNYRVDFYSHYDKLPDSSFSSENLKYFKVKGLKNISTLEYLRYIIYNKYKKLNQELAQKINKRGYDFFILGPDWITQTSILSNYIIPTKVHIGTELKREYYEQTEWGIERILKQYTWKKLVKKIKNWELESLSNSEKVIVHSIYSKSVYKKVVNQNKIHVIYPFVNQRYFKNKKIKTKNKKNFLLTVGRPSFLKGHDFIIKAISKLERKNNKNLKIIGQKGSHSEKLKKYARRVDVNLSLEDNISNEKLLNYYKKAKMFIYFPRKEPFGLSIIEALMENCKVLAINEGGFTELAIYSNNCKIIPRNLHIFRKYFEKLNKNPIKRDSYFKNLVKNELNVKKYSNKLLSIFKTHN
jgi:glycosyltransferase involved in cell wall biosynthesis